MAAGARAYLTKPLDMAEFFRVIDETIRDRKGALECAVERRRLCRPSRTMTSAENDNDNGWQGEHRAFRKMKILIIDDEPANVALLEDMLSEAGYKQLKSVTDSRLALETCETFAPDLVLLDLMMPHVDGFTILHSLRSAGDEVSCRSSS